MKQFVKNFNPTLDAIRSYDDVIFGRKGWVDCKDYIVPNSGGLREIIASLEPITIGNDTYKLLEPMIYPPKYSPDDCIKYKITYKIDIRCFILHNDTKKLDYSIYFASIPFLVGSTVFAADKKELFDLGGYFIINGREIALTTQEENRHGIALFKQSKNVYECFVKCYLAKFNMYLKKNEGITIQIASHSDKKIKISLSDFLYLMGEERDITEFFDPIIHNVIQNTKRSADPLETISLAFTHGNVGLTRKARLLKVDDVIKKTLLPFLGDDIEQKKHYLIDAASKLAKCALGIRELPDLRSLEAKRIATVGILFYDMIQKWAHIQIASIQSNIDRKEVNDIYKSFDMYGGVVTNNCEKQLNTGKWHRLNLGMTRKLRRADSTMNPVVIIRRINIPIPRKCDKIDYRLFHGSKYGFVCMASTPEGKQIGLLVSPSVTASISLKGDYDVWKAYLIKYPGFVDKGLHKLKLNERFIGYVSDLQDAYQYARKGKQCVEHEAAVLIDDDNDILVDIDEGRMIRPLVVYGKQIPENDSWEDLLRKGIVEYVDAREQSKTYIKILSKQVEETEDEKYTHVELHDANMFSLEASCIPFANHNQGPRIQLASVMNLGGIGICKVESKDDKENTYRLQYAQKPLCMTDHSRMLVNESNGINANVCVAAGDYNQEDSCIISKGFVERAGLTVDSFHVLTSKLPPKIVYGKPDYLPPSTIHRDYSKLDADGIIYPGAIVRNGTVLACKIRLEDGKHVGDFIYSDSTPRPEEEEYGEDLSDKPKNLYNKDKYIDETIRSPVRVDKVRITDFEGITLAVRFVQTRKLVPGDKIASRHSQKNIVSRIVFNEDMPVTVDGIIPDIIVNPHMLPSRVTIGQPIESLCSKLNALEPLFSTTICDATSFSNVYNLDEVQCQLKNRGFSPVDTHRFIHPFTGEMIDTPLVMGMVYYMRLPHFGCDKIAARSDGAIVEKTRQPVKGKSQRGGQRCGEMETHCFVAHGAGNFEHNKRGDCSDVVFPYVCRNCGIVTSDKNDTCCDGLKDIVRMSYSAVNLQRYARSANIDLKYFKKLESATEDNRKRIKLVHSDSEEEEDDNAEKDVKNHKRIKLDEEDLDDDDDEYYDGRGEDDD